MNPLIEKELRMLRVARLPDNWETSTTLFLPRVTPTSVILCVGRFYLIELESYLLRNPELSINANWNRGCPPTDKFMKVLVNQKRGQLFQVIGSGFDFEHKQDLDSVWQGWLPFKSIRIINELREG